MDLMEMDLAAVSEETLGEWVKATSSGIFTSLGIQGIDLSGLVSLVPCVTPWRDSMPRMTPEVGATTTQWRALLNVNNQQPNAATQLDYAGSRVVYNEVNVSTPYFPLELVTTVTRDSVMIARSYADALAIGTMQNFNQVLISENINLQNATNYALPTIAAPTLVASSTGGTLGSGATVYCAVAARSGENYFYGGSGAAANQHVTVGTTTSTNSISASTAAIKGAVAYDWFLGTSSGNMVYFTTTIAPVLTITAAPPTAAQAVPNLAFIYQGGLQNANTPSTPPTGDTSFNANMWMNGVRAQILGDYGSNAIVTPGTGTSSGAYWKSNNGATFTAVAAGIQELDDLNMALWNNALISPSRYRMSSQTASDLTTILTASGLAYTVLPPTDAQARSNLALGQYVKWYLNKAVGGRPVAIEVDPHLPPGEVTAVTDSIPYPMANIDAPFSVRCLDDYYAFEYAPNYQPGVVGGGPRNDIAVRSLETQVVRAPVTCGIISAIGQYEA